jgi:nucleotide-binding universal stress UspA family protein
MLRPMRVRRVLVVVACGSPGVTVRSTAGSLARTAGARLVEFEPPHDRIPAIEIIRAAERDQADLIVLARAPRDTVEGTVRRAHVPCLVVPPGGTALRKILAAVAAGPDSDEILAAATTVGRLVGGEVIALHVAAATPSAAAPLPAPAEHPVSTGSATAVATAHDVMVRHGDPVTEVLGYVRDAGIELLVYGQHRGGPRDGHATGSVAARLLQRAPCAVLTVPI